ncbi:MAG: L,D-transpeptidase family protein [Polaromonas sp.]|nr:L,D-transpeptidase family protein [Polaromonas sp.]MDP2256479.1 L,D-transpeptidase family protein [Polaromonas sp.]MDP3709357.1 L,D-transpeptidase family protein [Polaromonas sp.]
MTMTSAISRFMRGAAITLCLCSGSAMAADGPLWFSDGRPAPQAHQAIALLADAASQGLEPQDYNATALQQAIRQAAQGSAPEPVTIARLETALTTALERYLSDLHRGRIDPQRIHHNYHAPRRDGFDPAAYLRAAVENRRLAEAAREAEPRLPLYARLREALGQYRERVGHPAWQQSLPPLPGAQRRGAGKLAPGQDYAGLAMLAQRLAVLGDLAPGTPVPLSYEGPLLNAVQAFQQRHGLAADGVIGKATLTQLQVTPAARVRQIELMLERLRWTPLMQAPRMIVINIPEFVLRAYEVQGERIHVLQEMKVVVGKSLDTRTPLFDEDMRFIEFSPYWNVPPSIARAETVPKLRRDPGYLAREEMEFVSADGRVDRTVSASLLDAVLAGQSRIRQRPGPKNALGDIKFVFPNRDNIYLHHTPATQLFERARRDFSHGCIRVEQPVALAKFVLKGMPEWTEERIQKAMSRGESATLRLAEPVPVLIAYGTALVKEGRIFFFEDIYGLDRLLDTALRQRAPNPPSIKE